ncbi:hypothetical protein Pint_35015 [Pistacia integerrima]|uniref:Uncharacterized protein n=1 Tax=Pistacia integerrima TaxID=434235 RepID=A0ACC0Y2J2_9ROSI|nr:hypothetical protein Pint_35015 [Pistacia integerrima]
MVSPSTFQLHFFLILALATTVFSATLSPSYYEHVCPQALPTIKRVVEAAVNKERRMGASLLRLHFHDCFVQGCDASNLLDSTSTIDSEKNANPNNNSARGFEVIDQIKNEVDKICGCPVVSCADILAVAARDSVVALGGPTWNVHLGRRDSTTANRTLADNDIPAPTMDLPALINNFKNQGLDERIHDETNIDDDFAEDLQENCPRTGGDGNLSPLDPTPARFDTGYFSNLLEEKGLLKSDQALLTGGSTDELVKTYSQNLDAFSADFANSMIKMGNIKVLTGNQGQIRSNCRRVN